MSMMDALVLPISRDVVGGEGRLRAAIDAHYDVVWRFLRRTGCPTTLRRTRCSRC